MTPLDKMTRRDLEQCCHVLESRADGPPLDLSKMTREQLVGYINTLAPHPSRARVKPKPSKKPRMKNRGVGKFIRGQLARVIGPDNEGMSYRDIVDVVQKKFPDSMADERHVRWYATQMRSEGVHIPMHRKRSKW